MRTSKQLLALGALLAFLPLTACTVAGGTRIAPESHFVYPNSNVQTLGPVNVTLQTPPTFFVPPASRSAETDQALYRKALRQHQGADLIVDYVVSTEITMVPLPGIQVYLTKHELEGTAAKMVVGKQHLR